MIKCFSLISLSYLLLFCFNQKLPFCVQSHCLFKLSFCEQRYKNEEDLAKTAVDHPKETVKGKLKNSKDVSKARNRIVKTKVKKTQASEKWVFY